MPRLLVRALVIAILVAIGVATAVSASEADARPRKTKGGAAAKLRCAKGTTMLRDARKRPVACVGATAPKPSDVLTGLDRTRVLAAIKAPKGAKRSKLAATRAAALAQRVADPSRPLPGVLQRQDVFDDLGRPDSSSESADGLSGHSAWVDHDGMDVTVDVRHQATADPQVGHFADGVTYVRQRGSGGQSNGQLVDDRLSRCPTADGLAEGTYGFGITKGTGAFSHGKRTWSELVVRLEGPVAGHVGDGAKAETFDADLHITVEVRSWVEVAATGKIVKRGATRTYRGALKRSGLPIDLPDAAAAQAVQSMSIRGPHGRDARSQGELDAATSVVKLMWMALAGARDQVRHGDDRWYEQRACAKVDATRSPQELSPADTATWDGTVLAADGTPVPSATWTASTGCAGTLTPTSAKGATAHFQATPTGGPWSRDPYRPACVHAEVLSRAGRPPAMDSTIQAKEKPTGRYRFTIGVDYGEDMGPGVTPTHIVASGTVEAELGGGAGEGLGTWQGTEWDGGPGNPCGDNMTTSHGIGGVATAGAKVHADGTASVYLVTRERPLEYNWLVVVPLDQQTHEEVRTTTQPFCGTPGAAKATTAYAVTIEPLPGS